MNYMSLIQRHGVLAALVIILAGLLAATNGDMLSRFESFKFGPVEAKLRALSLKGTTARDVDAKEAGRLTAQRDTFNLWATTRIEGRPVEASSLIERARVISWQREDGAEPMLDAFDAFRRNVVTPFADLDQALSRRGVDLFDQPFSPAQTLHDAAIATNPYRPDSERAAALCDATVGLLRIVDGVPAWITDMPSANERRCQSSGNIDALICAASDSIYKWNAACSDLTQEDLLAVANSPYAIALVDTLIFRTIRDIQAAESFALVHYMNLFGFNKRIFPTIDSVTKTFDLLGKILVTAIVHRVTVGKIPPEETQEMLLSHYAEIESFVVSKFEAPRNRLERYKPCTSPAISGASHHIPFITARNVCERLEYITLPGVLNNLLFAVAEAWIQGRPVGRAELSLSEGLLARAEARLDILRTTKTDAASADEIRRVYFGLLDTVTLTRLMLAVEFAELPSNAKCRSIRAGFEEVSRYLRDLEENGSRSAETALAREFTEEDLAIWETLASVQRRERIAASYCGGE